MKKEQYTFKIANETIVISNELAVRNEFHKSIHQQSKKLTEILISKSDSYKTLEELIQVNYSETENAVESIVKYTVDVLIKNDIWDYNVEKFNERFKSDLYNYDEAFQIFFLNDYNEIQSAKSEMESYRESVKASRGTWVGGGFGMRGAIKGAIGAKALNMASGAWHGIGDLISEISDNSKINQLKSEILNNEDYLFDFIYAIESLLDNIAYGLCIVLEENNVIPPYSFNYKKAQVIYDNIISGTMNDNIKIKKLCECINYDPYTFEYYEALYDILGYYNEDVYKLSKYFGYEKESSDLFSAPLYREISELYNKKATKPSEYNNIAIKMIALLVNSNYIDVNLNINEEFVNRFSLCDATKIMLNMISEIDIKSRTFKKTTYDTWEKAQKAYEDYVRELQKEKKREETIENIGCAIKIAISVGIVVGMFAVFKKSGIIDGLINMFRNVGR